MTQSPSAIAKPLDTIDKQTTGYSQLNVSNTYCL